MNLRDASEDVLAVVTFDTCAIAFDGGSISVGLRTPDGARFSIVLDREIGSPTTDRLCFDGDRADLIDMDHEGPWLDALRRLSSGGSIEDDGSLDLVVAVMDVLEARARS